MTELKCIWYIHPKTGERKFLPEINKDIYRKRQGLIPEEIEEESFIDSMKNVQSDIDLAKRNIDEKVLNAENEFHNFEADNTGTGKETLTQEPEKKPRGRKPKS